MYSSVGSDVRIRGIDGKIMTKRRDYKYNKILRAGKGNISKNIIKF